MAVVLATPSDYVDWRPLLRESVVVLMFAMVVRFRRNRGHTDGTAVSTANGALAGAALEIARCRSKPHITAARTPEEPLTYPAICAPSHDARGTAVADP
jgi:hypothetical protein